MKLKKRIISIFLSLSLLSGMFLAMPTTASAASEENVEKVMSFLESTVEGALDTETIFTNYTATQLLKMIYDTLLGSIGLGVTPQSVAEVLYEYYDNNPLAPYANSEWVDVPDSIDWGIKAGDMEGFLKVVRAVIRPLSMILTILLPDGSWQEGDGPANLFGLPVPLYRFGLYDVMNTLQLKDVAKISDVQNAAVTMTTDYAEYINDFPMYLEKYNDAKAAGDQAKIDELKPTVEEYAQKSIEGMDQFTGTILNPVFALIRDFFADPLGVIMEKLPLLDKAIRNGEINWIIKMILPDAQTDSFTLVDLANQILTGIQVDGKPLGLTLTEKDMSAWAGQTKTQTFESLVVYVCEVLRNETDGKKDPANMDAVKALLAGMDLGDMQSLVNSVLDSVYVAPNAEAAASNLINTLAMAVPDPTDPTEPTDPTTPTDPTDPSDTTKPTDPSNTTKPTVQPSTTEPGTTTPGGSDVENPGTPQTGDVALGVFAMLSISAAAAYVIVRKKKD